MCRRIFIQTVSWKCEKDKRKIKGGAVDALATIYGQGDKALRLAETAAENSGGWIKRKLGQGVARRSRKPVDWRRRRRLGTRAILAGRLHSFSVFASG